MFVDGTSVVCIVGDASAVAIGLDLPAMSAVGVGASVGAGCGAEECPAIHFKMAVVPPTTRATSNSIRSSGNLLAFEPPVFRASTVGDASVGVGNSASSDVEAGASNPWIVGTDRQSTR